MCQLHKQEAWRKLGFHFSWLNLVSYKLSICMSQDSSFPQVIILFILRSLLTSTVGWITRGAICRCCSAVMFPRIGRLTSFHIFPWNITSVLVPHLHLLETEFSWMIFILNFSSSNYIWTHFPAPWEMVFYAQYLFVNSDYFFFVLGNTRIWLFEVLVIGLCEGPSP